MATQEIGSSAVTQRIPVLSSTALSRPEISEPPPVSTIPLSEISLQSSGGVCSKTWKMASTIAVTHSDIALYISFELTSISVGKPETISPPFTVSLLSGVSAQAVPKITFKFSAVLSPMLILWFLRIYLTMASSNLSPATLIDVLTTIPPNEITATSVVPPPISTTIEPQGLEISSPAPKAAATGSSIINT